MADAAPLGQWSFNGGEISPRMQGRVDQAVYQIAVGTMLGWMPMLQGPAVALPGTRYVETALGRGRLIRFEYSPTQGYVIEATDGKFRFYTNDARIETSPGVPYEISHPYSADDLEQLDFCQSADVLYIAGAGKEPMKLSRLGPEEFEIVALTLTEGPIDSGNTDKGSLVSASGSTGTITLTCNNPIFEAGHVGGLFELEAKDFGDVKSWEPGIKDVANGTKVTWGGRVYRYTSLSQYTGTVPPVHEEGSEWDGIGAGTDTADHGPYGGLLLYLYNRYGLVRITEFISPNQVEGTVIKALADSLTTTSSWRWAFGAFSDARGWPDTVGLWNDSLVLTKDAKGYAGVIGDYQNFARRDGSGDFQRDLAGTFNLPSAQKIVWQAADRLLLLGSESAEFTVERVQVQTGTPGPPVFEIKLHSTNGSRQTKPIQADGRMLFVQRAGRKLRELGYAISSDRYLAPDMTRLADHIGAPGFIELVWQAEPERIAWAVLGDGTLAGMTYDPQQDVMGWFRRELGNGLQVKSACRITDPEGKRDQLWLLAETEAGAHWVLRMEKLWEFGDDQADAFFLDAGLSYDDAPATVLSGLDHLEGETVEILADGKPHPERVVEGGSVTLAYAASKVHIGLGFPSYFETLEPGGADAKTKIKRIPSLRMEVVETQGISVKVQEASLLPVETRTLADPMDEATPLYTGLIDLPTIGTYEQLGKVRIERTQPTPATVIALIPMVEVGER